MFAALASASGKSQDNVRQLARLACPLLTRLVLHHNQIAEVRFIMYYIIIAGLASYLSLLFSNLTDGGGSRSELGSLPHWNLWNVGYFHKVVIDIITELFWKICF